MAVISTSAHLDPTTRPHADSNPGKAANSRGNPWPKTLDDDLKLPNGKTVGETPDAELRTALHALGVEGAHRDGRNLIVARFSALIANFKEKAGNEAVAAYLAAAANK